MITRYECYTKAQWIAKYGGQELLDLGGLEVIPCGFPCHYGDNICYG